MALNSCCSTHTIQLLIPWSVFVASMLGSVHCVGMCGGLVLAATRSPATVMVYHIARLIGYMVLGMVSGYLGYSLSSFSWVPYLMGGSFIVMGGLVLTNSMHVEVPFLSSILKLFVRLRSRVSPYVYALLIGGGSIFLPCGWLYAFVLSVSQTKSPWVGAGYLAIFWLGTLPALTIAPYIIKRQLGSLSRPLSALIFVGVGLLTIWYRV